MTQRAVLFDFGGVLIRMDWDGYDEFGKRWNLPAGTLVDAFYRTPEWHAIETGRGNWDTWQRGVEQSLKPYLQGDVAEEVQSLLDAWYAQPWQYHHPNFELAHDLQAAGHKIGVLSNAPDDLRDRFLSDLPVEVNWDAIVVSGRLACENPNPRSSAPARKSALRPGLLLHRRSKRRWAPRQSAWAATTSPETTTRRSDSRSGQQGLTTSVTGARAPHKPDYEVESERLVCGVLRPRW